mgnify:CR=1 FL=1
MRELKTREDLCAIADDINTHTQALWELFDAGQSHTMEAFGNIVAIYDLYTELRRYESRQRHNS